MFTVGLKITLRCIVPNWVRIFSNCLLLSICIPLRWSWFYWILTFKKIIFGQCPSWTKTVQVIQVIIFFKRIMVLIKISIQFVFIVFPPNNAKIFLHIYLTVRFLNIIYFVLLFSHLITLCSAHNLNECDSLQQNQFMLLPEVFLQDRWNRWRLNKLDCS